MCLGLIAGSASRLVGWIGGCCRRPTVRPLPSTATRAQPSRIGDITTLRMTREDANSYNRISGLSVERIQTLSDGVFAVAMTLLVLDLRVPAGIGYSDGHLWQALQHLGTTFAAYLLSFTMLGTFWLAQHTLLSLCARGNRTLTWLQVGFLFVVTLLPFSASLLAELPRSGSRGWRTG
jgi:hypothetical protein